MELVLDAKMETMPHQRVKASIQVTFGGGGFTLSNIILYYEPEKKSWQVALPLAQIGSTKRPVIVLQKELRIAVYHILRQGLHEMHAQGLSKVQKTMRFQDTFRLPDCALAAEADDGRATQEQEGHHE